MVDDDAFKLTIYYNDKDLGVDKTFFYNFSIYEVVHFGMAFAKLKLLNMGSFIKDAPIVSGTKLKFKLVVNDKTYEMKFIVHEMEAAAEFVVITLVPEIYVKLIRDTVSKGFNDKIENIVKDICKTVGIESKDVESTSSSLKAKKFLLCQQNYFSFIKDQLVYAHSDKENYGFFIDKMNKLKFKSFVDIKNDNSKLSIIENFMKNVSIRDSIFAIQSYGGFGGTGYYFNWEKGELVKKTFGGDKADLKFKDMQKFSDKLGINKDYISESNTVMMLSPVGKDLYFNEEYNKGELENTVLKKNLFNLFVDFDIIGSMVYTPLTSIYLYMMNKDLKENKLFSGKWIIYSVEHFFTLGSYTSKMSLTNSFYYNFKNDNFL